MLKDKINIYKKKNIIKDLNKKHLLFKKSRCFFNANLQKKGGG
ncbi:hypothetical protein QQU_3763 [Clostridioides difficile P7]|nr:hypothetical protein QQU_3763 [Clostridioides difficile P7]